MSSFDDHASHAHELARSRRMLTVEDVDLIGSLVRAVPPEEYMIVVDLGAGSGTTALAVFCARPARTRVFSFDVDQDALNWTEQAVTNAGFESQWRGFPVAGRDGVRHWEPLHRTVTKPRKWIGVDVLLHDAGHEEGDVARDIRAWAPRLVPGARVWVHDYAPAPEDWGTNSYPGVKRDVDELVAAGMLTEGGTAGMGWSGRYTPPVKHSSRRERRAAAREARKRQRTEVSDGNGAR